MKMNADRIWLLKKAEQEDGCFVSVGGLVKDLAGSRAWEYAYSKGLEAEIENLRDSLENGEGRGLGEYQYLCGQIRGIRVALNALTEVRDRYNADDDVDLRSG